MNRNFRTKEKGKEFSAFFELLSLFGLPEFSNSYRIGATWSLLTIE